MNRNFTSPSISNAKGDAKWTEGDAFSGVRSSDYWSSSEADTPTNARGVDLDDGRVTDLNKRSTELVWPVRGGP